MDNHTQAAIERLREEWRPASPSERRQWRADWYDWLSRLNDVRALRLDIERDQRRSWNESRALARDIERDQRRRQKEDLAAAKRARSQTKPKPKEANHA